MLPELQAGFEALEAQRARIEASACASSEAEWSWQPKLDEWSIGQIVQHLVLSDEEIGSVLEKREQHSGVVGTNRFLHVFVLQALKHNVRLPLPTPTLDPRRDVSLLELLHRWEVSRRALKGFLQGVSRAALTEKPFHHPIIGGLSASQLLELGRVHTAYHERQMQRVRRQVEARVNQA